MKKYLIGLGLLFANTGVVVGLGTYLLWGPLSSGRGECILRNSINNKSDIYLNCPTTSGYENFINNYGIIFYSTLILLLTLITFLLINKRLNK